MYLFRIRTGEKMRKIVMGLCIVAGILVVTALAILIDILVKQRVESSKTINLS